MVYPLRGDVPRVDGILIVARKFGDKTFKRHLSSDSNVEIELIDNNLHLIIFSSDGLWKVILMSTLSLGMLIYLNFLI
uniref:PPM-type phosphatase domain-containing protein n=1 Tax=Solanum lycopersicum TaxID=4081 RepID=A0A3Q7IHW0_SOLLC